MSFCVSVSVLLFCTCYLPFFVRSFFFSALFCFSFFLFTFPFSLSFAVSMLIGRTNSYLKKRAYVLLEGRTRELRSRISDDIQFEREEVLHGNKSAPANTGSANSRK